MHSYKLYFNRFLTNKKSIFIIIAFFFTLYNVQAFLNHHYFRTNAMDYGFHLQAFWNFLNFKTGPLTIFHNQLESYFQIHPSFTLLIITPFCWILKPIFGSYTLIFAQNFFLIIGGWYTYKVIFLKSKNYSISLIATIHYFVLWGHFSAIAFEYIDATIASTMVPAFFYFFLRKKHILTVVIFLFIISSRENMPLWFIFIGIFLVIDNYKNKKQRNWSFAFSIVYLMIIFSLLIPYFHNEGYTYGRFQYSSLGNNITEAFIYIVSHPIHSIKLLFINHLNDPIYNGIKIEFWYMFLLSGGILLIWRSYYLLLFVPLIAQKLYSDDYQMWGINIFYSIEIVSLLSIAAYSVILRVKNKKMCMYLAIFVCIATLSLTIIKMNSRESKWYIAEKEKIYEPSFYKPNHNIIEVNKVLELIPKNASVCANEKLVPHLAFREKIYYYPYINDAEYLVLLLNSSTYPLKKEEFTERLEILEKSEEWKVQEKTNDIILWKREINK